MQRRDFSKQLAGAGLGLAVAGSVRAQGGPIEGTHYVKLATPLSVSLPADKKVEVVEFFSYGCPHCYNLEPLLEPWVKKLPADVSFRQVPVGFSLQYQVLQKTFYALEELGLLASMHRKVFAAIHGQGLRLNNEADVVAFMQSNGVNSAKFGEAFKSFGVSTKANRAKQLSEGYKIDGVPALGIQGRFYTAASLAGTHERALAVTDFLIQRARNKT
ncbi:MAG: thiol:disulfide interchange protein DsbA/DsbL [Rubrivivax sp.]|jgi:thiol:disulfide interchange protein DsbA|nr:thiol:disulfide interchange protein DsbA/DsbL [Rubrivivax sp.]